MKSDDSGQPGNGTEKKKKARPASLRAKSLNLSWALIILGWTCLISMLLSFFSIKALEQIGYLLAFILLGVFILLNVLFDVIGIAVAAAISKPFHSMAARRVNGSYESLRLIKNAEKVSNICNDVVGDIAGIISGTTSAVIVARITADMSIDNVLLQLIFSGLVAGLTVGGKAVGKSMALNHSTEIVFFVGRFLYFFKNIKNVYIKK